MTNPQCWTNSRRTSTVPLSCSACSTGIPERKGAWQLAKDRFCALKNGMRYTKSFGQGVDDPSHTDAEKDFFEIFSFSIYIKKITCYC